MLRVTSTRVSAIFNAIMIKLIKLLSDIVAIEEVIEERDPGVIIQSDLKCSKKCLKAVCTANKV